ncbi:TetR/AcrR family transcriptional regulator [Streptomyces sp. NPDC047917]|uniref:TetR/AcrR family transcriptional regulator n=1 Tax=Streptomyces sp. NPDC047917 TaxID=3365491 RepID=UPI003715E5A4
MSSDKHDKHDEPANRPGRRPRLGREQTVAALVTSARALFAERGPDSVSLRDVAQHAGVNHGLIHHYIGGREDLIRAVLDVSERETLEAVRTASDPLEALARLRSEEQRSMDYVRLVSWLALSNRAPSSFQERSSALDAAVSLGAQDSAEVREAFALAVAQLLGWELFGAFALRAAGLDGDPADHRGAVHRIIDDYMRSATELPDAPS